MTDTPMKATTGPERAGGGATPHVPEPSWLRPEYVVVETALEVTAYALATR